MIISLYLIEILHQTTTRKEALIRLIRCILLKFYIKPQPAGPHDCRSGRCILLKFYIKPQPSVRVRESLKGCILLKFYIKPQHWSGTQKRCKVVSYWNSTSNHNEGYDEMKELYVVSYWNSTSNHNQFGFGTTSASVVSYWNSTSNHNYVNDKSVGYWLYLIEILHQTTTRRAVCEWLSCCILLKFYIKPQLDETPANDYLGCILLKFYIKPQLKPTKKRKICVVSYWNSTSNHNLYPVRIDFIKLYLIEILHQTTTTSSIIRFVLQLYLIEILHQTTTAPWSRACLLCCILLKFYIKPQP